MSLREELPETVLSTAEASGHVIVCGTEGIAMRIVEQLVAAGERVIVLGEFVGRQQREVLAAWGVLEIPGTGDTAETLTRAGLGSALSIVCVTGSDVRNLELALLARDLRSDVRIVSQLGNRAIGGAVAAGNGPGAVLDIADLAAPAIVEVCLRRRVHSMQVNDVEFLTATLPVSRAGTLRDEFGDLAPVAVVRGTSDGSVTDVVACPGRDLPVRPGDQAAMLGTAADFAARSLRLDSDRTPDAGSVGWRRTLLNRVGGALRDVDRGLFVAVGILVSLVIISSLVLRMGYRRPGMSELDALYFSVETVATVGYGDFTFVDQQGWLRLWAIFLMIAGITSTAVLMAFLADLLISRRLGHAAGRRRARSMSGHVVLVGLGSVGMRVAADLVASGTRVVVVERNESNRFLSAAAELGVPVVFGDSALRSTLEAARVQNSAAVAVITSDDMVNIETGLVVRDLLGSRWTGVPVVMRVFDRGLSGAAARRFGFQNVQPTEEIATPWFVGGALGLEVLGTFSVGPETFMLGSLAVEPGSRLSGMAMDELSTSTRVLAITRSSTGAMEHPPRRGTRFEAGDLAYLVGPYEELLGVLDRARVRL
jgi:Trk K+ transport system NAD-binding subunit